MGGCGDQAEHEFEGVSRAISEREGGREGGRKGGRKKGRRGGREGGREGDWFVCLSVCVCVRVMDVVFVFYFRCAVYGVCTVLCVRRSLTDGECLFYMWRRELT